MLHLVLTVFRRNEMYVVINGKIAYLNNGMIANATCTGCWQRIFRTDLRKV